VLCCPVSRTGIHAFKALKYNRMVTKEKLVTDASCFTVDRSICLIYLRLQSIKEIIRRFLLQKRGVTLEKTNSDCSKEYGLSP